LHVIQLPTARGILDTFKKDNPGEEADARAAFLAIDTRMRKGLLQIHSTSTLLIELIAFTINGFTGTRTSFLTTWYAKLRDLQMTVNPGQGLSFTFIRSILSKSLQSDPDLSRVFDEVKVGDEEVQQDVLYRALFDRAINMDETHAKKVKETQVHTTLIEQELNNHPGYQAYLAHQSYEVNRSQVDESLKIPGHVYSTLSRESKIALNNIADDDKRTLVSAMTPESGFKHNRKAYAASTTQSPKGNGIVQDDDIS